MFLNTLSNNLQRSLYRYPDILSYLYSRKVTDDDIKKYGLGYSNIVNPVGDSSKDYKRFADECWKGKKFEKKLTFPIRDQINRLVGLSGRSVKTKEFKNFIINEAKHSGFFFGLPQALPFMYDKNYVVVVEGFFDAIALSKVFPNTVASMTAGLMDVQFDLLKMYCDVVIVAFDMDKAGNRAKEEAVKRKGVYSLDIGYKDPARCLEVLGLKEFVRFMQKKITVVLGGVLWL